MTDITIAHPSTETLGEDLQRLIDGDLPAKPEDISAIAANAQFALQRADSLAARLQRFEMLVASEREQRNAERAMAAREASEKEEATRWQILEWAAVNGCPKAALKDLLVERLGLRPPEEGWTVEVRVRCVIDGDEVLRQFDVDEVDGYDEFDEDFVFYVLREVEVQAVDEDEAKEKAEDAATDEVNGDLTDPAFVDEVEVCKATKQ